MFLAAVTLHAILTLSSGADFDDPEYGVKEEDKDIRKVPSCPECFINTFTVLGQASEKALVFSLRGISLTWVKNIQDSLLFRNWILPESK
jgi:hypothetical protein